MNVSELKVNDRVGYCRSHYETFMEKGFGVVIKINGHGHIYVTPESGKETKVFDKYGYERKKKPGISTAIYRKQAMKQRGRYGCHLVAAWNWNRGWQSRKQTTSSSELYESY